jgi:ParB/RepB/Spo0J family partition protein
MNNNGQVVMMAVAEIFDFPLNPRRKIYREIETLMDSLAEHGQETPLAVWTAKDGTVQVLQGHRRLEAMHRMGWESCKVVEHEFADEGEALKWLMNQQLNNDDFDLVEKSLACQDLLRLGVSMEETCRAVGRTTETVQLWLALGEMNAAVHRAVKANELSLETVGMLAKLEKGKEREEGLQMVLNGMGGAMSSAMAKLTLQQHFIEPKKNREEWIRMLPKLKKALGVDEYEFVEFERRREYVQGDTGQPEDGYEWALAVLTGAPKAPEGVASWGDAAKLLGLKLYAVPAPSAADGYVVLVSKRDIKTVDMDTGGRIFGKTREVQERGGSLKERVTADMRSAEGDTAELQQTETDAAEMEQISSAAHDRMLGEDDELLPDVIDDGDGFDIVEAMYEQRIQEGRRIMAQVQEKLAGNTNLNRTQSVWLPLLRHLLWTADANALMQAYAPQGAMAAMEADKKGMAALRWVILHGLALAIVAGDDEAVAEVLEAVGVE